MSDVVERAEAWLRDVHTGSAAEIIPNLLDEIDGLQQMRAAVERARALADEWQAELDGNLIQSPAARAYWQMAADELRAALTGQGDGDE